MSENLTSNETETITCVMSGCDWKLEVRKGITADELEALGVYTPAGICCPTCQRKAREKYPVD